MNATADSARDDSNWREILEYFQPAFQLGMTATPRAQDNADTYDYFGNPIYTYSLRQGIEDGFLAPYRVHRVVTTWDAAGWRPSQGELDRYGRAIPDEEYQTKDFERRVSLCERARRPSPRHLTDFLAPHRPLRQDHRLLRRSGTRRRDAAGAWQPERRPGSATIPTTSAGSHRTRATSGAGTSAGSRTSNAARR